MKKKLIICIMITFAILAGGIVGICLLSNQRLSNSVIKIYSENALVHSIQLNEQDNYDFTITNSEGKQNTIQVAKGYISVISSDCPDKICVNTAPINSGLIPIVCVPNKLIIRAEAIE